MHLTMELARVVFVAVAVGVVIGTSAGWVLGFDFGTWPESVLKWSAVFALPLTIQLYLPFSLCLALMPIYGMLVWWLFDLEPVEFGISTCVAWGVHYGGLFWIAWWAMFGAFGPHGPTGGAH